MPTFSQYIRRSFAGAAATVALAAGMTASAADAPQTLQYGATMHKSCVPFEKAAAGRAPQKYDEPLGLLIKDLQSYSGWNEIRTRMKEAGIQIDGLCPSTQTPPPITPLPAMRGIAVNIMDPETEAPIDPQKFMDFIKEGALDSVTSAVLNFSNTAPYVYGNNPLFARDQDFQTVLLLETVFKASTTADSIMMAAESAVENDHPDALEKIYATMPAQVAAISDLHAKMIVAQKQNRDLTDYERNQFRRSMVTLALQNPHMRAALAQTRGVDIANFIASKMSDDAENGRPVTAPVFRTYSQDEIAQKLKLFPGNLADLDAVKNYKTYWESHKDKDGAFIAHERNLQETPAKVKEIIEDILRQQRQQSTSLLRPKNP